MEFFKDLQLTVFVTVDEWRRWLEENHDQEPGVWLKFAKKGSGYKTITYEEARNTAIAFGWIDGLVNRYDESFYLTRFTPRTKKSGWSKINCAVAEALIEKGKMHPSGLAHVDAAKRDGRWERAYDSQSTMVVPADFKEALDQSPMAALFFESLAASNRYSFLYRIQTAATPSARAAKIKQFIEMLENKKCYHPDLEREI